MDSASKQGNISASNAPSNSKSNLASGSTPSFTKSNTSEQPSVQIVSAPPPVPVVPVIELPRPTDGDGDSSLDMSLSFDMDAFEETMRLYDCFFLLLARRWIILVSVGAFL